jgi:hypothetical protein
MLHLSPLKDKMFESHHLDPFLLLKLPKWPVKNDKNLAAKTVLHNGAA